MRSLRPTVRVRLALLYGVVFVVTGAVLLTLNYVLVRSSLVPTIERASVGAEVPVVPAPSPSEPSPVRTSNEVDLGNSTQAARAIGERIKSATLRELLVQSSAALGVMSILAVGLGWLVAGRVLRPLSQMTETARRLSDQNLHERIALQGPPDELKELADTFDDLLGRLDAAFEAERRFVSNASHELRTPLAVARTAVDVLDAKEDPSPERVRRAADGIRAAVDRSEHLIDALLLLARSRDSVRSLDTIDLAEVVTDCLADLRPRVTATQLRVTQRLRAAPITGERMLVQRMIGNLLDNAMDHNARGRWIHVTTGTEGGTAFCTVSNSGLPIQQAGVDELFRPFRRGGPDRTRSGPGLGLGLSIVRAVAEAHGGTAVATAREEGGLSMRVDIPQRPTTLGAQG